MTDYSSQLFTWCGREGGQWPWSDNDSPIQAMWWLFLSYYSGGRMTLLLLFCYWRQYQWAEVTHWLWLCSEPYIYLWPAVIPTVVMVIPVMKWQYDIDSGGTETLLQWQENPLPILMTLPWCWWSVTSVVIFYWYGGVLTVLTDWFRWWRRGWPWYLQWMYCVMWYCGQWWPLIPVTHYSHCWPTACQTVVRRSHLQPLFTRRTHS